MTEQWVIGVVLIGSALMTLAASKGILDVLFHLMTLARPAEPVAEATPRPPATL